MRTMTAPARPCGAERLALVAAAADTPALALPAVHIAAAFAALLAAGAALVAAAPDIGAGAFLAGRVTAAVHLVTLGWITTTIMGVLYQFLPVALGAGIRSRPLAWATFALHVPGVLLFVHAAATGARAPLVAGAALVATALAAFVANLAATLARVPGRSVTWWGLAAGSANLLGVVGLGAVLAANLAAGGLGEARLAVVAAHVHLALLGFVMPVVVGVGRRLFPMFLVAQAADGRPSVAAVAALGAGAPLLALGLLLPSSPLAWTGALSALLGMAAFAWQVRLYFRARRRPRIDPGMRMAAAGVVGLAAATLLGPAVLVTGAGAPRLVTAYGLVGLLGGLAMLVLGHYYKIVPFLVWYHRFSPQVGLRPVPRVADLVAPRPPLVALEALSVGVLTLAAGAAFAGPLVAQAGAVLFAAGAAVAAAHLTAVVLGLAPSSARA